MAPRILVPLDGSAEAEYALPMAVQLARRLDATLRLVHVHGIVYGHDRSDVRPAEEYMDETVGRLREDPDVPVEPLLLEGNPATELSGHVREHEFSLVVLAADPKSALDRFIEGSVSETIIRSAGAPILLIRPAAHEGRSPPEATYRRALIPLDGSAASEKVVEPALESGLLTDAHVTFVHVVDKAGRAAGNHEYGGLDVYLSGVAERLRDRVARVDARVIEAEEAAGAVLTLAHADDAGLIAMSTYGRGGLKEALLGSTAKKVVREAAADFLLVRKR